MKTRVQPQWCDVCGSALVRRSRGVTSQRIDHHDSHVEYAQECSLDTRDTREREYVSASVIRTCIRATVKHTRARPSLRN